MSIKKIITENKPEDLAGSMLLPKRLTAKQKEKADRDLAEHRLKRSESLTPEQKKTYQLARLKIKLENHIRKGQYDPALHFGYFLDQYLQIMGKKKKDFASEINIHQTQLSSILKNRRDPGETMMIRLEIHSGNTIPAIDWFKLQELEKEYQIRTDSGLRDRERKHVRLAR
jgi:plasmid maintenance system antidote protein VapI